MGSRILYEQVTTEKPLEDVKQAARQAFQAVGGRMEDTSSGIKIKQGSNGVSYAFSADISADVNVREVKENSFEVECVVRWSMNALSWICLIVGIFVFGILWLVPLLYLFVNPETSYMQALHRVQTYI